MTTADLGLFGPGSVTWKLHDEPILWLAGLRSLYLQALHPRAMAGVAQNSDFREDPWRRLIRTSNYIGAVVFGTTAQARAAGARVRALHARLRAVDPRTGEFFRIDEPDLLRWVHVSEVESFLTTAVRAGVALTPAEIDRYYAEQLQAAALVGLDPATVPDSAAAVAGYYERMRPELAITRDSADAFVFLSAPPMPYRLGLTPVRLAYTGIAALAVGLLPAWARRMYGLPGLPTTDLSAGLSVRALRALIAAVPRRFYAGPVYRAAMSRVAAAGSVVDGSTG
ncbi:MAG: DUF2236 domain-containing protein [Actinobacteria bacterium]|nr:MAG: DUF2236 domain-containing protein [Actinomycetota bacterium]